MKKLTKLEVGIVLVIFGLLSIVAFNQIRRDETNNSPDNLTQNKEVAPSVRMISVAEHTPYVVVSGEYPQFTRVDASFNRIIQETVEKAVAEHKTIAKENWDARRDTATPAEKKLLPATPAEEDLFPFFVKTDVVTLSPKLISVLVHYGGFQGGAHGFQSIATFNYDLGEQKQITLVDLFPNDPLYLDKVSDFVKEDLIKQFEKKTAGSLEAEERAQYLENIRGMIAEGTAPKPENFAQFTVTEDAVTFYFGEYQVAPYVEGEQKVVMPLY